MEMDYRNARLTGIEDDGVGGEDWSEYPLPWWEVVYDKSTQYTKYDIWVGRFCTEEKADLAIEKDLKREGSRVYSSYIKTPFFPSD